MKKRTYTALEIEVVNLSGDAILLSNIDVLRPDNDGSWLWGEEDEL